MEKYAYKIIEVLHRNNIQAVYNAGDKLVYAWQGSAYEEIFGVYDFDNGKITGCTVLSCHVPERSRGQVLQYIEAANSRQARGRLYLDSHTQCVAHGIDYHTGGDTSGFEDFCMKGYDMFSVHLQSLYHVIHCSPVKGGFPYTA